MGPQSDSPDFEPPDSGAGRAFAALVGHRWVRWSAFAVVVALAGATAYYQIVVEPELTATRYEVWVAGGSDRVVIGVDDAAGVVTVAGGRDGMSQMIAARDSLFVLAEDVGARTSATWVEISWTAIAVRPAFLIGQRVRQALSIGHVRCEPLAGDAAAVVSMLLEAEVTGDGRSLCGAGAGAAADEGQDVLVDTESVRPAELPRVSGASVVAVAELTNVDAVLAAVIERLRSS